MDDLATLDATAQADLVRNGDASPLELVDAAITRIEKLNPELNAVIHPLFERARTAARGQLPDGPFRGVPTLVKDLDGYLAGEPYHAGNKLLKELGYRADSTSFLFEKLEAAGFVITGKTNTPEFGLLPTTETEAYGPARNPWNTNHSTGGSSGGSGAAVAAGLVPVAHAGDGGGSIRIPASMGGVFGLKPSRGRISLGPDEGEGWAGLVVRHVITRSVRDSAAVLDALEGYMPGDPYAAAPPERPYRDEVGVNPGRLRIGIRTVAPGHLAETDDECVAATEDAARLLESLGHSVEPAGPAGLDEAAIMEHFSAVMFAGTRADIIELERIAGRPVTEADVEPATWMTAQMAATVDGGAYVTAVANLHRWCRRVVSWWLDDGFDLLLTPTLAEPPPVIGDVVAQPEEPYRALARAVPFAVYTGPFNMTGQPAVSVPTYFASSGLPIGVQLVAAPFREDVLVRVSSQIEQARPWADRRPPLHA